MNISKGTDEQNKNTHDSAIFKFNPPATAILRCVKNSVFSEQLIRGSASCGELIPRENQSSLSVDVPAYFIEPKGMTRSEEI